MVEPVFGVQKYELGSRLLVLAALESSSTIFMVLTQQFPAIRNAQRYLGSLMRMGFTQDQLKVVVNQYVKKAWDIAPDEVVRTIGLELSWLIPNDFKNAIAAINYGEPVVLRAPRSEMSVALNGLAEMLGNQAASKQAA